MENRKLNVGDAAPDFTVLSHKGEKVSLSEYKGKNVVLYFYPKDMTPGCTQEACSFRDSQQRIQDEDAVILGVSLDSPESHVKFMEKYELPFSLLSDVDAEISRKYGVYKEKNSFGQKKWGIERTTFIIDREGIIRKIFPKVKVDGHVEEVIGVLREEEK